MHLQVDVGVTMEQAVCFPLDAAGYARACSNVLEVNSMGLGVAQAVQPVVSGQPGTSQAGQKRGGAMSLDVEPGAGGRSRRIPL